MLPQYLLVVFPLLVVRTHAQALTLSGTNAASSTSAGIDPAGIPTGSGVSYISYTTTATNPSTTYATAASSSLGTMPASSRSFAAANSSVSSSTSSSSLMSVTLLVGGVSSSSKSLNGTTTASNATRTSSSTSSSPQPTNTQPCNNYPQFCERNYSNITYVAAHNSPFVRPGNAASNQALYVTDQLNDGIRMLQFQTHYENNTMYLCHTSCQLLNAGTLQEYFTTVASWIQGHPYDVVTILMGNSNLVNVNNFTAPITSSGLLPYVYTPPKIPMNITDWPKLSTMILQSKRVVIFMDYNANQTAVPYVLDEFSQLWETPFSPQDRSFPCTVQRPPGLSRQGAESRMYMANHNLNQDIALFGNSILVPNTVELNETNAVTGFGSLGRMAKNCTQRWDRPPNFLLVDYYNYGISNGSGQFNGSVFEVAALMNNVTYNRTYYGMAQSAGVRLEIEVRWMWLAFWTGIVGAVRMI